MKVSLNINFSVVNQCNCYQICYRNSDFVTISRDMRYTVPQYHILIKYLEKENLKLGRYLISRVFGFETLRGYKILRKCSKIAKIAKSNTRKI